MSRLSVRHVSKVFAGQRGGAPTTALQPISREVEDNDFITVLGPSGCGKSTLHGAESAPHGRNPRRLPGRGRALTAGIGDLAR